MIFLSLVLLCISFFSDSEGYAWYEAYCVVLFGNGDIKFVTLYVIQAYNFFSVIHFAGTLFKWLFSIY